jgi:hypothetical protein
LPRPSAEARPRPERARWPEQRLSCACGRKGVARKRRGTSAPRSGGQPAARGGGGGAAGAAPRWWRHIFSAPLVPQAQPSVAARAAQRRAATARVARWKHAQRRSRAAARACGASEAAARPLRATVAQTHNSGLTRVCPRAPRPGARCRRGARTATGADAMIVLAAIVTELGREECIFARHGGNFFGDLVPQRDCADRRWSNERS